MYRVCVLSRNKKKSAPPNTFLGPSARPLLAAAFAAWWSHQSHAPVEGCRSPAATGNDDFNFNNIEIEI